MDAAEALVRLNLLGYVCRPLPNGQVEAVYCLPRQPSWQAHREAMAILNQQTQTLWELLLDPRPDLTEDHSLWRAVLLETARLDPHPGQRDSLYGLLHGLRCCGARLMWRQGRLFLDIRPVCEDSQWEEETLRHQWLLPQLPAIRQVFAAAEARLTPDPTGFSRPKPVNNGTPAGNNSTSQVPMEAVCCGSPDASEVAQLAAVLRRQGWAVVESTRLGCQLILARNRRAAEQALQRDPGLLVLLRSEWPALLACETPDEVELFFAAKQHLGGVWLVPLDQTGWPSGGVPHEDKSRVEW